MQEDIIFLNLANIRDLEKDAIFTLMPDLALVYLGEYLVSKGYNAKIFDEHVDGRIDDNPNLFTDSRFIGISMYGLNNNLNLSRIAKWKSQYPGTKFIIGGSSVGFDIFDKPDFIDYMVIGQGYYALGQILSRHSPQIIMGGRNELDFPASFFLTPLCKYKSAALLCSLGCPFSCTFCLSNKLKIFQTRKKENVFQELDLILGSGIKYFEFFDDIFTLCPYIDELTSKIKQSNKKWGCVIDSRQTTSSFKTKLCSMIDSGLSTIGFGFESLSNITLRAINKKLTNEQIKWNLETVRDLRVNNLRQHAFLMYGLPFQTKENHLRDIETIESYGFYSQSTHLKVIRGTKLWDLKDSFGIETDDNGLVTRTDWMSNGDLLELDLVMDKRNKQQIKAIWAGLV